MRVKEQLPLLSGLLVLLGLIYLHLIHMAPTITTGDSAELSTAQTTLGIAHSPGYPLFVLLGKISSILFPFGSPAFQTNLFSCLLSGITGFFFFSLVFKKTESYLLALSSTGFLFSLSVFQIQFISTEVFALNSLFLILLLYFSLTDTIQHQKKFLFISFLFGLGLGNQHTLLLIAPFIFVLLLTELRLKHRTWRENALLFSNLGLFFILGLTLYLYLPIRSLQQPLLDWEDPETFNRFWNVITRDRYGTFQLAQGSGSALTPSLMFNNIIFFTKEVYRHFTIPGFLAVLGGLTLSCLKLESRAKTLILILIPIFSGPFFLMLSNVGTGESGYGIISRFFPMPFIAILIAAIIGLRTHKPQIVLSLLFIGAIFLPPKLHSLTQDYFLYDHGKAILNTLPNKATLFTDRADETEFSLAYFLYSEGRRKDIRFVDCNAGVTKSIYGEDYYQIWGPPRLEIRELIEKKMLFSRFNQPNFYATIDPKMINIPRKPNGILFNAPPFHWDYIPWHRIYRVRLNPNPNYRDIPMLTTYGDLLGRYLQSFAKFDEAKSQYRISTISDPYRAWHHSFGLRFLESNQFRHAEYFLRKAVQFEPEKDKILCNLGTLYERTNQLKMAEAKYKDAIQMNSNSFQAHYNLGVLYWKMKRWKDVVHMFSVANQLDPSHEATQKYLKIAQSKL